MTKLVTNGCYYCGSNSGKFNKEHVIPKSNGGKFTIKTCFSCNNSKSNYSLFEFFLIGGINKHNFLKLANFIQQTRPKKEYLQLFSINCFEYKIKEGYFDRIIEKNISKLNFEIIENEIEYIDIFKTIAEKIKSEVKINYSLSSYFVKIKYTPFDKIITKPRLNRYIKIINKNLSISDEIIKDLININTNYHQTINKIKNTEIKTRLTMSFLDSFYSKYSVKYFEDAVIYIKKIIS